MMIANWMHDSVKSQVIGTRLSTNPSTSPGIKLAGATRRVMPKKRDREVPYGMKGGESLMAAKKGGAKASAKKASSSSKKSSKKK
jgi:hypothetical protein